MESLVLEKKVEAARPPRILAIIPAYNEQDAILQTLHSLQQDSPDVDVLVVNDGSLDHTVAVAKQAKWAAVLDLPCNLGIGGAVQAGFKFAERQGYDIAIQFDADGQHLAREIPKLIAPIRAREADVTIGSRFLGEKTFQSTFVRRIGIYLFYMVNSFLIRQPITDNTSGFRAYNRQAIAILAEHYPMDYPEPEAVILLGKNGFTLKEVAVAMQERQGGVSSINLRRSVYYMIKVFLAIFVTYFREPLKWRKPRS